MRHVQSLFRMLRLLHSNLLGKENEIAYQERQLWFRNTPEHHYLNKSDLAHLLLDPRWTRAVFYRNPKSRFLSAFRSKCEHRDHDGKARCENAFKQTNISFVEAMEALKSPQRREEVFLEPHFMPMRVVFVVKLAQFYTTSKNITRAEIKGTTTIMFLFF